MKRQLVAVGIATAVSVTGLAGMGIANAATDSTSSTNPMSSMVDAIATKFNLNKSDVQAVFDSQHTKMEASREADVKADVAQLVTDGKLTQDQADKINAKRAELEKEREANKPSATDTTTTREQRKVEMDAKRTELETWAKDNGIDTTYLKYVMGGGHGHGHGEPGGFRD